MHDLFHHLGPADDFVEAGEREGRDLPSVMTLDAAQLQDPARSASNKSHRPWDPRGFTPPDQTSRGVGRGLGDRFARQQFLDRRG